MKHTKGKWIIHGLQKGKNGYRDWNTYCVRSGKTNVHIATIGDVDRYYEKQNRANARLIAAAPDLLEACKGLTKAINKEIDGNPDFVDSPVYAWLEDAHEAISKAKGE